MGAEGPPVGVVKINMVFPADVFAFAHIVHQILQLILGIDVGGEDGGVQIFEEIAGDYGGFKIYIIAKTPLFRVEGRIAVIVVRKKVNGELLKGEKILAEQVRVLFQPLAVSLVVRTQFFYIGRIEGPGHDGQAVLPEVSPVVKPQKAGVRQPVVRAGLQQIDGCLHVLHRVLSVIFIDGQAVGVLGLLDLAQLCHAAGDFNGSHSFDSFPYRETGAGKCPPPACANEIKLFPKNQPSSWRTPWGT